MSSDEVLQTPKKLEDISNHDDVNENVIVVDDVFGDDEVLAVQEESAVDRYGKSRISRHVVHVKGSSIMDYSSSSKKDHAILREKLDLKRKDDAMSDSRMNKKYTKKLLTDRGLESHSSLLTPPSSNHRYIHITSIPGASNLDSIDDALISTDLNYNNNPSVITIDQLTHQRYSIRSTATNENYSIGSFTEHNRQFAEDGGRMSRRRSSLTSTTTRLLQPIMDHQGHAMSEEEMKLHWKRKGKCELCGTVTTHRKEKFGPFGSLRRMVPQTVEGYSYKGYCLRCYDVPELRDFLKDPDIPLSLERNVAFLNPEQFSVSTKDILMTERKDSNLKGLFSSIQCQLCCGAILLCLIGAIVAVGIILSDDAEPWISYPPSIAPSVAVTSIIPSSSPTLLDWDVSSKISTDIHSFGFKVKLSNDGNILAVSSPDYENGRGRFDVYIQSESQGEKRWLPIEIAATIKFDLKNESFMGMGMQISGDGKTLAIGSPGYEDGRGFVQAFSVDTVNLILSEKGARIVGPEVMCDFGYTVALNYDGTRLFIGAPNYGILQSETTGLVQAFDYIPTTQTWIQVGSDMKGRSKSYHFGYSLDTSMIGDVVLIGAPYSSDSFRNAGSIYFYKMNNNNQWYHFPMNHADGSTIESHMGKNLASNYDGSIIITNNYDGSIEELPGAGLIQIWAEEENYINMVGFPLSGKSSNFALGYDVAISGDGSLLLASGENNLVHAGSVLAFSFSIGNYEPFGKEIMGPPLGTCQWFGKGPSVAIASDTLRIAIGYECVMTDDEISKSEVRIFDNVVDRHRLPI
jgi:hypothetical protein